MDIIDEIIETGKKLMGFNMVESSHSGNISARVGDYMYIKKHGKMVGFLERSDIMKLDLKSEEGYEGASVEVYAHKNIYLNTDAKAIIHAHTPYAIVMSILMDRIEPVDEEGKFYLEYIPIIKAERAVASMEIAEKLGEVLRDNMVAVVSGHGTFARGENLEEALKYLTLCESISHISYLFHLYKR
ncbi:MAG: class II aldolase/adducin family protein [Thermoplasmata archaeon]